jgi:hypothetical protein
MESRPWYKKLFGTAKAELIPNETSVKSIRIFPLSQPNEVKRVKVARFSFGYTKGAFGNHKRRIPKRRPSTDPRFNHALRRIKKQ